MRTSPAAALVLVALATTACTGSGAQSPTASGSTGPTTAPTPPAQGMSHPTGANEIILRFDEAGGFVPAEFLAAHVPYFTLYGDGTVVFVSTSSPVEPSPDGVMTGQPIRTGKLSEEQIQALLEQGLGDGGLGVARAEYQNPLVADAPTAIFEINADGGSKTVSVVALGMEDMEPGPDTAIKKKLAAFGARLRDFDQGGTLQSSPYVPSAYRGVLLESEGLQGVQLRDWPWPDLAPADFKLPADPNTLQQRTRTLTPEEVEVLGVEGAESGIQGGIYLRGPDDKQYTFSLRPLLPDEKA